ncbi:MAG: DNA-3-methyladenine glycosylase I [Deltaproteobacteria bacterium]|nr:DNA-3-methyladenine glycosylase I [Deltaproteobacteria bacterium]
MKKRDKKIVSRCSWPEGDKLMTAYHDKEWGVPLYNDMKHFEFLMLEVAQAGLSWRTVLYKREGYRRAFAAFDPVKVARFDKRKVESLMKDAAIIRNRQKISAAVANARAFLKVRAEFGTFSSFMWSFVGGAPKVNRWKKMSELPAVSEESAALSMELKRRGFKFVGPTTMYAHMQAAGLVNDHVVGCFRHKEVQRKKR